MAIGDVTVYEEAKAYMIDGGWEGTDNMKIALITTLPTAADATPALSDYTECTPGGNYVAVTAVAGETLDTLANCVTETGGTMTFDDTGASVSWAQNGSNPTDARAAVIVNADQSNQALAFVDLGSAINMQNGDLTITWNASGIFTIV